MSPVPPTQAELEKLNDENLLVRFEAAVVSSTRYPTYEPTVEAYKEQIRRRMRRDMNAPMTPKREELEKMTNDELLDALENAARDSSEMMGYGPTILAVRQELKRRLDAG